MGAFSVDAASGSLTAIPGSFPAGSLPLGNAVTADGRFQYVANRSSNDISAHSIGADGTLTQLAGSPYAAGASPTAIAVSVDGRFVYTGNTNGTISMLAAAADGTLAPIAGSPMPSGGLDVFALAVTPDGRYLYSANDNTDNVSAFAINADGTLTAVPGSPFPTGDGPIGLAIAPDSSRIYVTNFGGTGSISAFQIAPNGSLNAIGSPTPADRPRSAVITPAGDRLYAGLNLGGIAGFQIAADGALTPLPGSPYPTGIGQTDIQMITITPNQGPAQATLTISPARVGQPTTLTATGSDPDGAVARYAWDFGDGSTAETGEPTTTHVYETAGGFVATVRLIDSEGCSATTLYTGQNTSCNASATARASSPVDQVPTIRVRGAGARGSARP